MGPTAKGETCIYVLLATASTDLSQMQMPIKRMGGLSARPQPPPSHEAEMQHMQHMVSCKNGDKLSLTRGGTEHLKSYSGL